MLDESQLQLLIENMPNVAVEGYDLDGRVLLWNRAAESVFGFKELEAVGRTLDQLILTPEAAREFVELLQSVHASGEGVGPMQWDFRRRDGSIGTVLSTIVPFPFPDGAPRFLCIDLDITENSRIEQALRESEQRFRTMAETSLVGLWQITPEGNTVYINPAMLAMIEVPTAAALTNRTHHGFFTPESIARMRAEHARRASGVASIYEVEIVGARGTHRSVIISGAPLFNDDGSLHSMIGTFTDISERKKSERQLNELLQKQRATLNELDHRVRNNLASLLTLIDVSAKSTTTVDAFAESIRNRVRAMSIVHNLLSQSKWVSLSMHQILEQLVPSEARAAVQMRGPNQIILPRQCTPLAMVLQELMSNSVKHGALSASGGRLDVSWALERAQHDAEQFLVIHWLERGGPATDEPATLGTGLEIVHGIVESDLRGTLDLKFPREGASHTIRFLRERPNHNNRARP